MPLKDAIISFTLRLPRDMLVYIGLAIFLRSTCASATSIDALAKIPTGLAVQKYDPAKAYDGYLVFCPEFDEEDEEKIHGPRIYHPSGALFWAGDEWRWRCMNARFGLYRAQQVLTFWYQEADHIPPSGVILDTNYKRIKNIHPFDSQNLDMHEFHITPTTNDTLLMIAMHQTIADLRPVGGIQMGRAWSPYAQEVDIDTNLLLWEWNAAKHLSFAGSYRQFDDLWWDYAHCNAVVRDEHGDYLLSFRFYSMIVKVDHKTNHIIWRLGGKDSDFTFKDGSSFIGQHDPQWVPGTDQTQMTLFDNDRDNCRDLSTYGTGRGIWIKLDYDKMSVSLMREYLPPSGVFDVSAAYNSMSDAGSSKKSSDSDRTHVVYRKPVEIEGGMQLLPNGNVLVAFGSRGAIIEYIQDGSEIVFQAWTNRVYRAYKFPKSAWSGSGLPDPREGGASADLSSSSSQEDTSLASGTGNPQVLEIVEVDDDVNMYFGSGSGVVPCKGLRGFFGLC
ncbi:hypothetical protein FISHEDRAFT_76401 [Fistulina hepatica ATCC 64428]|uniref:ASST-domain-containing protein n=1 Tax=Fistulina hepatica ATCC 64428 TaxID=1128425 RepID=A0A0D7A482_9AGAR|nr:hypothetical protein FISHEDRAFT_76401 [Fistulina hepatica ATCC 64428]